MRRSIDATSVASQTCARRIASMRIAREEGRDLFTESPPREAQAVRRATPTHAETRDGRSFTG
jgi:hypothetical protein